MHRTGLSVALVVCLVVLAGAGVTPQGRAAPPAGTVTPAASPTPTDNDYTRINNAIQSAASGGTVKLLGTFDWSEANAAASWALGSDGTAATADDYSIYVPANLNNVTLTADNLGDATIQGPGDLAAVNLESVLVFDGGDNQNWTISNLRFLDFDLSIAFFGGAGGADAFNGTHITGNEIRLASDLNATVAPADVNQNIGIHFSWGVNQVISGNTIEIQGNAVSDSGNSNFATDVGMQSNSAPGTTYDGLLIANNAVHVLNAQSADPESILGIWENGVASASDVTVVGNRFVNDAAGNNPATNRQRGFRVTSHSSATTTVTYQDNYVSGANTGFQWLAGFDFSGNSAVELEGNTIVGNATGVLVQSNGLANLSQNRIVDNSVAGLQVVSGSTVTAENNWWGCNAGPGNTGCGSVTGTPDSDPWLVLGADASPTSILVSGTSTVTADLTTNSDAVDTSGSGAVPITPVAWSATNGSMSPTSGVTAAGQASSTYTPSAAGSGSGCADVDHQHTCASITVNAVTPGLSTTASAGVTIGGNVSDTATLSGGFSPTGSITFNLYGPDDATCSGPAVFTDTLTVTGNGNYTSGNFTPTAVGTYRWRAAYSGDANNNAVTPACNAANESVVVSMTSPALSTTASADALVGGQVHDTATLSGGSSATGSITFRLYGPGDDTCTGTPVFTSTVPVAGDGNYGSGNFAPSGIGVYRWTAAYSGDAGNSPTVGACNAADELVRVGYRVIQVEPGPNKRFHAGAKVKIRFKLATAANRAIPNAEAGALAAGCGVRIVFSGGPLNPDCATFGGNKFTFTLKLPNAIAPGSYTIGVDVTNGSALVNDDTVLRTIAVR